MIVVLLAATFVPYAMSLREANNRARCTDNLRGISIALSAYAGNNQFAYPRTRFDAALGNRWTAFTGPDEANPFAPGGAVAANDVSASLWLLIREELAQPFRFVCPSSDGSADPLRDARGASTVGRQRGNFRSAKHLTYAVASPFSAVADYAFNDTLPANFVLVADQGPSIDMLAPGQVPAADARPQTLAMGNSVNHRRAGQNVLYASGTVQFETTPYCGVGRTRSGEPTTRPIAGDNIYTALAPTPLVDTRPDHASPGYAGVTVGPAYRYDAYLVPGADAESALADATRGSTPAVATTLVASQPVLRTPEPTPATPVATRPVAPPVATRPIAPPATTAAAAVTRPTTVAASRPASTTTPVP